MTKPDSFCLKWNDLPLYLYTTSTSWLTLSTATTLSHHIIPGWKAGVGLTLGLFSGLTSSQSSCLPERNLFCRPLCTPLLYVPGRVGKVSGTGKRKCSWEEFSKKSDSNRI